MPIARSCRRCSPRSTSNCTGARSCSQSTAWQPTAGAGRRCRSRSSSWVPQAAANACWRPTRTTGSSWPTTTTPRMRVSMRISLPLAVRFTQLLDAIGFPLCLGNVMATNPVWRKRISEWRKQIALWLRRAHGDPAAVERHPGRFPARVGRCRAFAGAAPAHHAGDRQEPDLRQGPVRDRGRPRRGARLVRAAEERARQAGPAGNDQSEAARQLAPGGSRPAAVAEGGAAGDVDTGAARRTAGERRLASRGSRQSEGRVSIHLAAAVAPTGRGFRGRTRGRRLRARGAAEQAREGPPRDLPAGHRQRARTRWRPISSAGIRHQDQS